MKSLNFSNECSQKNHSYINKITFCIDRNETLQFYSTINGSLELQVCFHSNHCVRASDVRPTQYLGKKQTLCNKVLFLPQLVLLSRYHKMYVFGKQNGFCSQNFFRKKNNFSVLCISTSASFVFPNTPKRRSSLAGVQIYLVRMVFLSCVGSCGHLAPTSPSPQLTHLCVCVCQSGIKTIVICLYIS